MRRAMLCVATIALLAMVLATPASASRGQPEKALPFSAMYAGYTISFVPAGPGFPFETSTFNGRCSVPSNWMIGFAGTGEASRLGPMSWDVEHCTQFTSTGPNFQGFGTYSDGLFTMVADNGDRLYGTHSGSFEVKNGVSYISGVEVITGGTGRFAGASGTLTESGQQDLATDLLQVTLSGTITYDASMRSEK